MDWRHASRGRALAALPAAFTAPTATGARPEPSARRPPIRACPRRERSSRSEIAMARSAASPPSRRRASAPLARPTRRSPRPRWQRRRTSVSRTRRRRASSSGGSASRRASRAIRSPPSSAPGSATTATSRRSWTAAEHLRGLRLLRRKGEVRQRLRGCLEQGDEPRPLRFAEANQICALIKSPEVGEGAAMASPSSSRDVSLRAVQQPGRRTVANDRRSIGTSPRGPFYSRARDSRDASHISDARSTPESGL